MNKVLEISFCLVILALSSFHISNATECNGCVILDSKTFEKVLAKFDLMLVKFDKYSPDLIKHAAFEKVATDLSKEVGMEDMIAAHVDIFNNDGKLIVFKVATEMANNLATFPFSDSEASRWRADRAKRRKAEAEAGWQGRHAVRLQRVRG